MRSYLTGENDMIVPYPVSEVRAIPFQWWEFRSEENKKQLAAMQAKDDYWTSGQGIYPDCYEFLKIREARFKRMGK